MAKWRIGGVTIFWWREAFVAKGRFYGEVTIVWQCGAFLTKWRFCRNDAFLANERIFGVEKEGQSDILVKWRVEVTLVKRSDAYPSPILKKTRIIRLYKFWDWRNLAVPVKMHSNQKCCVQKAQLAEFSADNANSGVEWPRLNSSVLPRGCFKNLIFSK